MPMAICSVEVSLARGLISIRRRSSRMAFRDQLRMTILFGDYIYDCLHTIPLLVWYGRVHYHTIK
jgi:hypothetical protein